MIWFAVLRSYKDAHAEKIVQRILNGTDKDKLLETVVHLETEQQKALLNNLKKRMQRFWTDVNNTPPPTRLGNFVPVTKKCAAKMRVCANRKHAVWPRLARKFCDRSLFLLHILANMYNHMPPVFWQ